ncbi:hypothetical protein RRG08_007693 [Elysia crispata]|uniref:Uncharacterized protein n=1 Tax=Elysia crispata TaxID=231223 RepID=A0AAE1D4D1_9GAST|nr:hypothetical protein RRG08_007693 [Elysia crispata]
MCGQTYCIILVRIDLVLKDVPKGVRRTHTPSMTGPLIKPGVRGGFILLRHWFMVLTLASLVIELEVLVRGDLLTTAQYIDRFSHCTGETCP